MAREVGGIEIWADCATEGMPPGVIDCVGDVVRRLVCWSMLSLELETFCDSDVGGIELREEPIR